MYPGKGCAMPVEEGGTLQSPWNTSMPPAYIAPNSAAQASRENGYFSNQPPPDYSQPNAPTLNAPTLPTYDLAVLSTFAPRNNSNNVSGNASPYTSTFMIATSSEALHRGGHEGQSMGTHFGQLSPPTASPRGAGGVYTPSPNANMFPPTSSLLPVPPYPQEDYAVVPTATAVYRSTDSPHHSMRMHTQSQNSCLVSRSNTTSSEDAATVFATVPPLNVRQLSDAVGETYLQYGSTAAAIPQHIGSPLSATPFTTQADIRYLRLYKEFMKLSSIRSRLIEEVEEHRRERQPLLEELEYYRSQERTSALAMERTLAGYRHDTLKLLSVVSALLARDAERTTNIDDCDADRSALAVRDVEASAKTYSAALVDALQRIEKHAASRAQEKGVTHTNKEKPTAIAVPAERAEADEAAPAASKAKTTEDVAGSASLVWLATVLHLDFNELGLSVSPTVEHPPHSTASDIHSSETTDNIFGNTTESTSSVIADTMTRYDLNCAAMEAEEARALAAQAKREIKACLNTLDFGMPLSIAGGAGALRLRVDVSPTHASASAKALKIAALTSLTSKSNTSSTVNSLPSSSVNRIGGKAIPGSVLGRVPSEVAQ